MTEMSRNLGVFVASSAAGGAATAGVGRVAPSRAALARVRRDLFGPVDHAAARAYADSELKAQSILDAERWGFDFRLEVPKAAGTSRFEWEIVGSQDCVPEPYALRGMPYLRKQSPATPRKSPRKSPPQRAPRLHRASGSGDESPVLASASTTMLLETAGTTTQASLTPDAKLQQQQQAERTPPQETRVPLIGERTPDVVPKIAALSFRSKERSGGKTREQPTTPVLSRKQAAITG